MRISVVVFPGSNCDHDVINLFESYFENKVNYIWHRDRDLMKPDLVVLPGGFSYGDYLRSGALAKISPAMEEVALYAAGGGHVLGICNGFQILCECGLLPGALMTNSCMRFLSRFVSIVVESERSFFTKNLKKGEVITCPIAHFEGHYYTDPDSLKSLEDNSQVIFRYCDRDGKVCADDSKINPNGSLGGIAGITNKEGNVVGLMPHPERSVDILVGGEGRDSGFSIFQALLAS